MSSPKEHSDTGGSSINSANTSQHMPTRSKVSGFKRPRLREWRCLLSRIANRDNDRVRQWCEIWGNIPLSIQKRFLEDRTSPMCEAAVIGSVDIIKILAEYGFHPHLLGKRGNILERFMPIHHAAKYGHLDVVKTLVEDCNAPVDTRNSYGWTALMWAVNYGHTNTVQYLLTKGANPNVIRHAPRNNSISPLVLSVTNCSKENAHLLLDSGANVNLRISNAGSVLNKAVRLGFLDMAKLLYNRGAKLDVLNEQGLGIMHLALGPRPNIALIRYLIELNVSLDVVTDDGYSPLCYGLISAADCELILEWAPLLLDAGHQLSRQDYNSVKELITFSSDQLEKIDDMVEKYLSVPRTLQQLCCFRIRRLLGVRLPRCIECLPLPSVLKDYIYLKYLPIPALAKA